MLPVTGGHRLWSGLRGVALRLAALHPAQAR